MNNLEDRKKSLIVNEQKVNFFVANCAEFNDPVMHYNISQIEKMNSHFGILLNCSMNEKILQNISIPIYSTTISEYYYLDVMHQPLIKDTDFKQIYRFIFVDIEKLFLNRTVDNHFSQWLTNILADDQCSQLFLVTNITYAYLTMLEPNNVYINNLVEIICTSKVSNNVMNYISTDNDYFCFNVIKLRNININTILCGKIGLPWKIPVLGLKILEENAIDQKNIIIDKTYSRLSGFVKIDICNETLNIKYVESLLEDFVIFIVNKIIRLIESFKMDNIMSPEDWQLLWHYNLFAVTNNFFALYKMIKIKGTSTYNDMRKKLLIIKLIDDLTMEISQTFYKMSKNYSNNLCISGGKVTSG